MGLGKPELECLIQTFKFPGQFGTHIDFPGHFIKGKALSEKYDVNDLIFRWWSSIFPSRPRKTLATL